MSEIHDIYFTEGGRPTRRFVALWKAKGAAQPLMTLLRLHNDGYATRAFRSLWKRAFPARNPVPTDAIATKDGQMTEAMLAIWLD